MKIRSLAWILQTRPLRNSVRLVEVGFMFETIIRILLGIIPVIVCFGLISFFGTIRKPEEKAYKNPFIKLLSFSVDKTLLSVVEAGGLSTGGLLLGEMVSFLKVPILHMIPALFFGGILLSSAVEDKRTGSFFVAPVFLFLPVSILCCVESFREKETFRMLPYGMELVLVLAVFVLLSITGLAWGDALLYFISYSVMLPLFKGGALICLMLMLFLSAVCGLATFIRKLLRRESVRGAQPFTASIAVGFIMAVSGFCILIHLAG